MESYRVRGIDGAMYGPVDQATLIRWAKEGRVDPGTLIQIGEGGPTQSAETLPFLSELFASGPSVASPTLAAAEPGTLSYATPYTFSVGPEAKHHLRAFPVYAAVLLHIFTFGLFSVIWFNLMHGKMPKNRRDDPSGERAVGFCFIPFFNLYWFFFTNIRLDDRIAEQRKFRGLPPASIKGVIIAMCICVSILCCSWAWLVGVLILGSIVAGLFQSRVNELVAVSSLDTVPSASAA